MKSLSLARVLPVLENFDAPRREAPRLEAMRPDLHVVDFLQPESPLAPLHDPAEDNQQHWQEGYEAGVAVGRAQAQSELLDHDVMLQDAIAAARAEWLAQESERIASGVEKALGIIETEICDVAARVLSQIVTETRRREAIAEFSRNVRMLLRDGEAGVVTVHAPEDLIACLEEKLGSLGSLEFVAHESAEVWVRSGATKIETRFDAWRAEAFTGE
jgi:hypothetical protein